jgi:hydrogenase maturation factor
MANALGIDPWGLLASGALLAAFPAGAAETARATLADEGFSCAPIARAEAGSGVGFASGGAVPRFTRDEMIRVFSANS